MVGGFVATLLARPLHEGTARAVALHGADTLAALEAGLASAEGRAVAAFFAGDDTEQRVAGMAAVIRFTECDDIEVPSCLTPGCIAIPVALEFAPDDVTFARAVEAGYVVGLAIARGIGGARALEIGVWPTLLAAPAVAAVTAAVAMGLDEATSVNALSLALSASSGRAGRPAGTPSGRWLAIGEAALKGVRAARAARAGFGGDAGLLSAGWLAAQSSPGLVDPSSLVEAPADAVRRVGLKPFVCARQGANAIEAMLGLVSGGLDAASIRSVEVRLPANAIPVVGRPLDTANRLSTIAHLGLQLAIACHEPGRLLDVARERPFAPETLALAGKVTVVADRGLDGHASSFPAIVRANAGEKALEKRCDALPGDAGDPNPEKMLLRKFRGMGAGADIAGLLDAKGGDRAFLVPAKQIAKRLWSRTFAEESDRPTMARTA